MTSKALAGAATNRNRPAPPTKRGRRTVTAELPPEGNPALGHRHERRLHQRRERQPRERLGGVRQVPRHPECGRGLLLGAEGRESCRRREEWPAGADTVDVAQEPCELDGEGDPQVRVDGPRTVRDAISYFVARKFTISC